MRRGVRVYCAWENRARLAQVLEHEAPEVIGSHWVDAAVLREAAQQGIPVVEHVHNMYIWLDEDGWLRERERSRHFAWTLAVSSLVKGYYSNWNRELDPARMAVLPNGIEARADLGPDYRAARERIGIGARDFLIVCLAAYDGIKNQLGLLAAFEVAARRYHEARIICAGSVRNRGYHAQVSRFVSGLSSRSRIHLWAKHAEASRLLAAADLYVVDSFAEGWSLAATEALAAGVPLVHSECGGARELVGEGERGILVPNAAGNPLEVNREVFLHLMAEPEQPNQTALVEAMGRMVEGRDQWQERRPELARAARQQFSLAGQVRGYSEVLERVRTRSPA
jgi:glycosyltransferase involved in cell wall biosynthesis